MHKILVEVADPNHTILTRETLVFTVPETKASAPHAHGSGQERH